MTIGVITGKFAPLHTGHIYAISKAATQCDHLYVVLSHDEKWLNNLEVSDKIKSNLSYKKKLLHLKTSFKDLDHITVVGFDETLIESYPEGVEQWCSEVYMKLCGTYDVLNIDKWFSSEPEYSWWIDKYFGAEHIIIDAERNHIDISATKIRNNPHKYWTYLPSIVRKDWLKKVAIIGTESSAKSTLTKYLAKMYNTSWVEEYGRNYCLNEMCNDESLLSFDDYGIIAANRFYDEKQAERTANKILFCDTNAFITQFYCRLYEAKNHPLVEAYIDEEEYDLILHLSDEVKWVDDGLRTNRNRAKTRIVFSNMLDEYGITDHQGYRYIDGDYNQRLIKAQEIIDELLK